MIENPERAHVLIAKIGADSPEHLSQELRFLADLIDQDQLTTGLTGSHSVGSIYSYKVRPEQTHDIYFAQIEQWLSQRETGSRPPC